MKDHAMPVETDECECESKLAQNLSKVFSLVLERIRPDEKCKRKTKIKQEKGPVLRADHFGGQRPPFREVLECVNRCQIWPSLSR